MAIIVRITIMLGLKELYFYYFSGDLSASVEVREEERKLCFLTPYVERSRDISYHLMYFLLNNPTDNHLEKSPSGSERTK